MPPCWTYWPRGESAGTRDGCRWLDALAQPGRRGRRARTVGRGGWLGAGAPARAGAGRRVLPTSARQGTQSRLVRAGARAQDDEAASTVRARPGRWPRRGASAGLEAAALGPTWATACTGAGRPARPCRLVPGGACRCSRGDRTTPNGCRRRRSAGAVRTGWAGPTRCLGEGRRAAGRGWTASWPAVASPKWIDGTLDLRRAARRRCVTHAPRPCSNTCTPMPAPRRRRGRAADRERLIQEHQFYGDVVAAYRRMRESNISPSST